MAGVSPVEQEQNITENPIDRIVSVIETSAATPEDQQIAGESKAKIAEILAKWVDRYHKILAREAAFVEKGWPASFTTMQELFEQHGISFQTNTGLGQITLDGQFRPSFRTLLPSSSLGPDGRTAITIRPSWDYEQKILIELGVLKPGQTVEELKKLPPTRNGYSEDGTVVAGPFFSTEGLVSYSDQYADRLPTNIPGVEVLVPLGKYPGRMEFSMDLDTFKQVVTSPSKQPSSPPQ